jgi:hypothetical protein
VVLRSAVHLPFVAALALAACGADTPPAAPDAAPPAADARPPEGQGDEPHGAVAINEIATEPPLGPDWIELRTTGDAPVDISGWYLTDLTDRIDHFLRFPAGTILQPGQYLLVYADDGKVGDGFHANFKLSREDQAYLLDPDGLVVDGVLFLGGTDGRSLARVPDGTGRFFLRDISPGAANP